MNESDNLSITRWFGRLRNGDDEAATMLWNHYFPKLVALARTRFGADRDPVYGAEDAALSVFRNLCKSARAGKFDNLERRDDLWRVLVVATRRKIIDRSRVNTSQKRSGNQHPVRFNGDVQAPEPTAETLAILKERLQQMLTLLRDDVLRKIAISRLEGATNAEIAEELLVSERTIERKLKLIREDWEKLSD